jgi:hypothetical protein
MAPEMGKSDAAILENSHTEIEEADNVQVVDFVEGSSIQCSA